MLFFLDVDECENSPCEHNGTCINNQGSYTCACVEGWQGENCKEGTACSDAKVVLELWIYLMNAIRLFCALMCFLIFSQQIMTSAETRLVRTEEHA